MYVKYHPPGTSGSGIGNWQAETNLEGAAVPKLGEPPLGPGLILAHIGKRLVLMTGCRSGKSFCPLLPWAQPPLWASAAAESLQN